MGAGKIILKDLPWTGLDFEGAGNWMDKPDEPVQIGFIQIHQGKILNTFSEYLFVDRPISPFATRVHRITNEMIKGKPQIHQMWEHIKPWWRSSVIVGHSVGTEKKFTKIFNMSGTAQWVDTLRLTRSAYPYLKSYKLGDILRTLSIIDRANCIFGEEKEHDALYDAIGSIVLLEHILSLPGWENLTLHQAQAASLKKYNERLRLERPKYKK